MKEKQEMCRLCGGVLSPGAVKCRDHKKSTGRVFVKMDKSAEEE